MNEKEFAVSVDQLHAEGRFLPGWIRNGMNLTVAEGDTEPTDQELEDALDRWIAAVDQDDFDAETDELVKAELATMSKNDQRKYVRNGLDISIERAHGRHRKRDMESARQFFEDSGSNDGISNQRKARILAIYDRPNNRSNRRRRPRGLHGGD